MPIGVLSSYSVFFGIFGGSDNRKAVVASYRNNCFFFYNITSYSTTILTVS